jgi:predicted MFS family arabinose efflux permease
MGFMRERHLIAFLTTVQFVHMVDFVLMMPLGPIFMRSFAINTHEFALMLSAYTFTAAASGIAAGFFIDRYDRRRVLLPLLAGLSLATLGCAWAPSYPWMVLMRALAGGFGGILGAMCIAVIPDVIPPERRGRAIGVVMASFSLASIIGIPIGMNLATTFSWHVPFLAIGLAGLLVFAWGLFAFPSLIGHITRTRSSPGETVRAIFGVGLHWRAFGLTVFLAGAGFSVISFISPYLVGNIGFRDDQLQFVYLTGGIASVVTTPLIGRLVDRLQPIRVFTALALLSIAPILTLTHLPAVGVPMALLVTVTFIVFVSGRFVPSTTLITNAIAPHLRGSFMSFNSAVMSGATGAAALIAGFLVTKTADGSIQNYPRAGWLATFCTIMAILLAWSIAPVRKPAP